jgi:hypothetical protein
VQWHFLWVMAAVLFLFFIAGLIFVMSVGTGKPKKRRKIIVQQTDEKTLQDWKNTALRLEKHIVSLKQDQLEWQKKTGIMEKETAVYKQQCADFQEKLERERGWQKKEEDELGKKQGRIQALESEVQQLERRVESEHSELLLLRRENMELKGSLDKGHKEKEDLESKIEKILAQTDSYRKEILDLRAENTKLSKRHEDTQWIAKSVHLKIKEELRVASNELARLKKEETKSS